MTTQMEISEKLIKPQTYSSTFDQYSPVTKMLRVYSACPPFHQISDAIVISDYIIFILLP